jgi:hypothetical protein
MFQSRRVRIDGPDPLGCLCLAARDILLNRTFQYGMHLNAPHLTELTAAQATLQMRYRNSSKV